MHRPVMTFIVILLLATPTLRAQTKPAAEPAPPAAEPPPHLEFVRGLRGQQMPEYALQYLQKLAEKPPADLALVLPLEMARARLDLAQLEPNETKRLAQYAEARTAFAAFVEKNPSHAFAAEANLEIARLASLEGKGQYSKALRQESDEARRTESLRARVMFQEAGKQLASAAGRIDAQLQALGGAEKPEQQKAKKTLTDARMQAELERGKNLLDQAQTYEGPVEELKQRGKLVTEAMKLLEALSKQDDKNPLCWEARVWLGRCHQENDNPVAARKVYGEVINEEGEQARAANRLARYFRLQVIGNDPNEKDPLKRIRDSGENWLRLYPNHVNTPEGHGVRFLLAETLYRQAQALIPPKAQQVPPPAKKLFAEAQRQFQILEQTKNDYSERARQERLRIILLVSQEVAKGPVEKLRNFEECFLRAQVEVARMNELAKKDPPPDPEKAAELRKQHYLTMIDALNRALEFADPKTASDELADARYLLTYAYLASNEPYRAAVVGEDLARSEPKSPRAPMAGAYALYAYSQIIHEDRDAGDTVGGHRHRLKQLAEYIDKTWPEEAAADDARYQLGLLLVEAKKYAEAVEYLDRISPAFGEIVRSQYQLAMAAMQAHKQELTPPKGKPSYEERAIRAIKSIPDVVAAVDAGVLQTYFLARLELSRILYVERKYGEMTALLGKLTKLLAESKELKQELRDELAGMIRERELLAQYGLSDAAYAKGEYAKVREALDPFVARVKKPDELKQLTAKGDPRLVYALLGLALRANVLDNQMDKANEVLAVIQSGDAENARSTLVQFVRALEGQIQELRKKEGDDAKKQLETVTTSFTGFLAELAKKKDVHPEMMLFLAQSYSTLDKHKEAAVLLGKIPEPGANAQPTAIQLYRASRILLVRALRQGKQFDGARAEVTALLKTPWGKASMDVQKERIFILEDQGLYGGKEGAASAWYGLMAQMQERLGDPKVRELYFEAYYHFLDCRYKNALKITDPKRKAQEFRQTAQTLVNLKARQPDLGGDVSRKRFEELLERAPQLKKEYDELLKNTQ